MNTSKHVTLDSHDNCGTIKQPRGASRSLPHSLDGRLTRLEELENKGRQKKRQSSPSPRIPGGRLNAGATMEQAKLGGSGADLLRLD